MRDAGSYVFPKFSENIKRQRTDKIQNSNTIKKSLRYSLFDGIFANVMIGFTDTFMAPYALAMGASAGFIGILTSMPNLAGAFFQNISATLSERLGSRKILITNAVFAQALMLLPIISIPYIFGLHRLAFLAAFYTVFASLNLLAFPAWSSLMADHVSESERGKVFGMRNRILGVVNVVSMFLAGFILYASKKFFTSGKEFITGFSIIFFIAFIARLISWKFLTKMYEPKLDIREEHRFTIWQFLKRVSKSNFGRFVIFVVTMNFFVNISGPFLPVYMINELRFNYLTYTIITLTATLTIFFMMNWWGLHADHIGNRRVMRLTSFFLPLIPTVWLLSGNPIYLVAMQIFAGFFWAGFNLSASNFIYDAVTPEKRTRCIAYFSVLNGLAIFFGAITGGVLLRVLPPVFKYKIMWLFIISALGRMTVALFFSGFKEVRQVKHVSNLELVYSILGLKPMLPSLSRNE